MSRAQVPLRQLTEWESEVVAGLRQLAGQHPVILHQLIAELVVTRQVVREIRRVRRCLPPQASAALDTLPHARITARESDHA